MGAADDEEAGGEDGDDRRPGGRGAAVVRPDSEWQPASALQLPGRTIRDSEEEEDDDVASSRQVMMSGRHPFSASAQAGATVAPLSPLPAKSAVGRLGTSVQGGRHRDE